MPDADDLRETALALLGELLDGPPGSEGYILNPGDPGLLRSLARIDAAAASTPAPAGGASIAAHVDHLQYGFSLMNRWLRGEPNPFEGADWAASWRRVIVTGEEWTARLASFEAEARRLADALRAQAGRPLSRVERRGVLAGVAHLAYHTGAIRQIHHGTAGPPAGD